uniref:Uncharacterized protein n=1 Tax=Meloidogyne enterolobii TaxID=390850 RepID=A0A6V7X1U9_MELEN|nr:unnamed protein product [Meloidogyne enterolobii]
MCGKNVQSTTRPHSITRHSRRVMDNQPHSTTNRPRSMIQPQVPTSDMHRQPKHEIEFRRGTTITSSN